MNFNELLIKAKELGFTDIDLYEKTTNTLAFEAFDSKIEKRAISESKVYSIRGVYNGQIATVYTQNANANIEDLLLELKEANNNLTNTDYFEIYAGSQEYAKLEERPSDLNKIALKDKIELILNMSNHLMNNSKYFFHGEASYQEVTSTVRIQNSKGLDLMRESNYATIVLSLTSKKDEEMKSGYSYRYVYNLGDFDYKSFAEDVIKETETTFASKTIPSKKYPVILRSDVVGSLLGAFSTMFKADSVIKKVSLLENKLNEQVFGTNISIYDDPFLLNSPSRPTFDDEGVATKKNTIVENGVLKTYIHNLSTAHKLETVSTGNGFKAGAANSVGVSFSNLCLEAGNKSLVELCKDVNEGVLITDLAGLHAGLNTITGEFNLQAQGFMIENGVIAKPISLIIISGRIQDILSNVVEIGNDMFYSGSTYTPSLFIKEMNISGN